MRRVPWSIAISLVMLAVASPGFAKAPADQITIRGPGLEDPVEIIDPHILEQFNPWTGQFLGEVVEKPTAPDSQPYEVVFLLRRAEGEPSVIYGFDYYPGSGHSPGYIKLPSSEEEQGVINRQTIIRTTDGRWHQATRAWDTVMVDQLDAAAQPGCSETTGETPCTRSCRTQVQQGVPHAEFAPRQA